MSLGGKLFLLSGGQFLLPAGSELLPPLRAGGAAFFAFWGNAVPICEWLRKPLTSEAFRLTVWPAFPKRCFFRCLAGENGPRAAGTDTATARQGFFGLPPAFLFV